MNAGAVVLRPAHGRPAMEAPKQTLIAYSAGGARRRAGFFGLITSRPAAYGRRTCTVARLARPTTGIIFTYARPGIRRSSRVIGRSEGIDLGESSPAVYALHALVGHHGIFSLHPDLAAGDSRGRDARLGSRLSAARVGALDCRCDDRLRWFLLVRRHSARSNYGGMTSGLRGCFGWRRSGCGRAAGGDWLALRRWGPRCRIRRFGAPALSASYPIWNPWTHPWAHESVITGLEKF